MVQSIALIALMGVLVIVMFFIARAAFRARNLIVRWLGGILASLVGLVFLAITVFGGIGLVRLYPVGRTQPSASIPVTGNAEQTARGEKLAHLCTGCHSPEQQFPLSGSAENFVGDSPLGEIWGANLTPGGRIKDWTDEEIARAIREGVDKDGRALIIMPSPTFHRMSDDDVAALVAYLRSQPAVERDLPETQLSPVALVMLGAGMVPSSATEPITAPVKMPAQGTEEYGAYLSYGFGCTDCHGANLAGMSAGPTGESAPNLTQIVPNWTQEQFIEFFNSGTDPSGRKVSQESMPYQEFRGAFSDAELTDMYNFLHNMPKLPNNP